MIFFGLLLGCFLVVYVMPGRRHRGMLAIGEFMASMMVSRSCPLPFWPV
jgi:hypothetical protein